jgi:outer membrane protein OmpA-like peptidoglycan-associated protein
MSYSEAINLYNGLIKDGNGTAEVFENLGNSHYFQSNYKSAKESYDSLFKKTDAVSLAIYYRYINVLRSEKKYDEADVFLSKLLVKYPEEKRKNNLNNSFFLNSEVLPVESIELKNSKINTPFSDFKVSYLGENKIVFSSSKETKKLSSIKSYWNNEAYTNLYESSIISDSLSGVVTKLKGSVNKLYNESSAVFSKDGNTMYFTRNNQLGARFKTDSLNNVLLKIYKATFNGKSWGKIVELPFNSNQYNCAHPALSPEEDYLYFSSDMPGSIGESDLYRVSINNNDYGKPENLGSSLNTPGRDTFPFITSNNILIFASDFRKGLGGLDLYYVDLKSKSKKVYTFSKPINSSNDDFGLIYNVSNGKGYLTSNREINNVGSDDIYEFSGFSIPDLVDLTISIKSKNGLDLLGNSSVLLLDANEQVLATLEVLKNQVSLLDVDPSKAYFLQINNENYESLKVPVKIDDKDSLSILLKEKQPENVAIDLKDILKLQNIYFDFEKTNIKKDAELELQKIVDILNQYPEIKIDIIGHTDSRGSSSYNERLSIQRAASTKQWLIIKGISKERMDVFGFGEKKPINDCHLEKKCTNDDYEKNRRTEFLIKLN